MGDPFTWRNRKSNLADGGVSSLTSPNRVPATISLGHGIHDPTRLFRPLVPDTDLKNIPTNNMEFESLAKALNRFIHDHRAAVSVSQLVDRIAKKGEGLNELEFGLNEPGVREHAGRGGVFHLQSGYLPITMWS